MAPLIGISADLDLCGPENAAHFRLRCHYAEALARFSAVPVILPCVEALVPEFVARFDGFVISGGMPGVFETPGRSAFETTLVQTAMFAKRPLLGICNGMQIIATCLGGRLVELSPDGVNRHQPANNAGAPAHQLLLDGRIGRLSRLACVGGLRRLRVNSLHRQAIVASNGAFIVTATAPDGTVEAIEARDCGYCLGVQWHPEYLLNDLDKAIWRDFVSACMISRA